MARQPGSFVRRRGNTREYRALAWQSMRILRHFTSAQIQATSGIGETNLVKYLAALRCAGYVRIATAHRNGSRGSFAVYQLVRNTGPRSPILRREAGQMYDQNTGQVFTQFSSEVKSPKGATMPEGKSVQEVFNEVVKTAGGATALFKAIDKAQHSWQGADDDGCEDAQTLVSMGAEIAIDFEKELRAYEVIDGDAGTALWLASMKLKALFGALTCNPFVVKSSDISSLMHLGLESAQRLVACVNHLEKLIQTAQFQEKGAGARREAVPA